jgi:O-succinylbenzoate synthase
MALASGCNTIKIKVGDPRGRDRVAAVRDALPDAALRVDVNGAWSLEQAVEELEVLSLLGLEYAEQPVRSFEDMVALRARTDVALAADELIRIDRRFDDVALAADVAVLKVAPLGGVRPTLQVAQRVGLPVVISSALDTSVGLAAAVAAACCLPEPPLACGLGTGSLYARDTTDPLLPVAGEVGWVDYPVPDVVETGEDLGYWQRRIVAAADVLTRS